MRYFVVFLFSLFVSFFASAENDSCSVVSYDDDCPRKGRVKIVDAFADVNIKVCPVTDDECGHIKIVDCFADVTIKFEDKESKERFIKALKNIK
ncbi:MAG: hypothetical protein VZQ58_07180 [Bacteroidales bacterium]|nr:hypothetical protein [Bacteroidales bacterium]